ncbi:RNA-directed DNA polymerase from transposon BS [Rhizoctonia solani]|uniref:RNA-directed DNA polymerase from transposon BS n=1 Tax=Rhizoctonia solani TaxID=456999 RepID=A0A8H8T3K0_9AGAM|nr:RNA-directed DNA polymerase from transposon BS [Rhizoctonia solani]QRW26653.1 RNA-directed DNA polymerase from transposon BS [Rhizoctonia solani]
MPYLNPPWRPNNPFPNRLICAFPPGGSSKTRQEKIAKNANRLIDAIARKGILIGFSDGAKEVRSGVRKVGVGYSVQWKKSEVAKFSGSIGPHANIFGAKMLALALIAQRCACGHTHYQQNQTPARSTHLNPVLQGSPCISQDDPRRTLMVQWIPGHSKIERNKRADRLANAGLDRRPTAFFNRITTWAKCQATQRASRTWVKIWEDSPHSKTVRKHIPRPPSLKLHPIFNNPGLPRSVSSRLVDDRPWLVRRIQGKNILHQGLP